MDSSKDKKDTRSEFLKEISSMTREEITAYMDRNHTRVKLIYPMVFIGKPMEVKDDNKSSTKC